MTMTASSELQITLPETTTERDAFKPPKNVEKLKVVGFENVIPLEEDEKENCSGMSSLHEVTIANSNCFFSEGPSKLALGLWKYFVSLETLDILCCNALSCWPAQEFRSLTCLKHLCISGCINFTASSQLPSSEKEVYEEDFLPRLESLVISDCLKLVEIPKICSKSLKYLSLEQCPSLLCEGLNWLRNLHALKELFLNRCQGLESLPDGLECLTSLESLIIS